MLFAYVALFSFAYLSLSASVGALILFGAVQLTMIGAGLRAGERFAPAAWAGLAVAIGGLVYLVLPVRCCRRRLFRWSRSLMPRRTGSASRWRSLRAR
jgi:hypothetical protein